MGVAFATEYLYYCAAGLRTVSPAPILDSVIRTWLATWPGRQPRLDWRLEDYQKYCDLVDSWSFQLQETPATVEYLMFASGIGISSQWDDQTTIASGVDATQNSPLPESCIEAAPRSLQSWIKAASGGLSPTPFRDSTTGPGSRGSSWGRRG